MGMTMPEPPAPDGTWASVLLSLGKLETGQAVADTKLDTLLRQGADHEQRLRAVEQEQAKDSGGRDTWARVIAGGAVLAAIAATVADYVHH